MERVSKVSEAFSLKTMIIMRAFSGCCLSNLLPANVGNYIQEDLHRAKIEIVTVVVCK